MDRSTMVFFLQKAQALKAMGAVNHIRCSTRPDRLDSEVLHLLATYAVDMIELGIQSFSSKALAEARRGYSRDTALKACRRVQSQGFELGVQLMPGMPGHKPYDFLKDVDLTAALAPDAVRLYPCLVLKETALEDMYWQGKFQPWSISGVFHFLSLATLKLWLKGVPVIRTGLAPEAELDSGIVAGPWHPALGAVCRCLALRSFILYQAAKTGRKIKKIMVPERYLSDFRGWRNINLSALKRAGITTDLTKPWPEKFFRIYF